MVTEWRMMTHAEWGRLQRRLGANRRCQDYLAALKVTPSSRWTDVCLRQQMTDYLMDALVTGTHRELVVADRYVKFDTLGRGGQGATYLAFDRHLADPLEPVVVVKESGIRPGTPRFGRLERECELLGGITSVYFPRLRHFDRDNGRFVMQYFRGPTISQVVNQAFVRGARVSGKECLVLAKQLAQGLSNIHRAGLVHRDIKPANVIIHEPLPRRRPPRYGCIVDWGLAKEVGNRALGTASGFLGTPYFAAPECHTRPGRASPASDVYSLACVIFTLLVGEPPFFQYFIVANRFNDRNEADYDRLRDLHRPEHRPRVSHFRRQVPAKLDELLFGAMEWNPGARSPKNGDEFYDALEQIRDTAAGGDRPVPDVLPRARLMLQETYREYCREEDETVFASETSVADTLDKLHESQRLFNDAALAPAVHSHSDRSAAGLHGAVLARFQSAISRCRNAMALGLRSEADRNAQMNANLDAIQDLNVKMLKLQHVLCD